MDRDADTHTHVRVYQDELYRFPKSKSDYAAFSPESSSHIR